MTSPCLVGPSPIFVPSARRVQGTMSSCTRVSVTRVFLVFFRQQPETTFEQCLFDFRIPRRHDVDGNFLLRSLHVSAHIARLFNDVGKFSMFKINLSYFPSRARLNFRWIFKEFDLKSNMKGFFENFLALSVKKLKKVLMILPSISGRGRAFPAESCRYMPCLAISNFYRRWNFHNNFQANCTGPYLFFVFVFF